MKEKQSIRSFFPSNTVARVGRKKFIKRVLFLPGALLSPGISAAFLKQVKKILGLKNPHHLTKTKVIIMIKTSSLLNKELPILLQAFKIKESYEFKTKKKIHKIYRGRNTAYNEQKASQLSPVTPPEPFEGRSFLRLYLPRNQKKCTKIDNKRMCNEMINVWHNETYYLLCASTTLKMEQRRHHSYTKSGYDWELGSKNHFLHIILPSIRYSFDRVPGQSKGKNH